MLKRWFHVKRAEAVVDADELVPSCSSCLLVLSYLLPLNSPNLVFYLLTEATRSEDTAPSDNYYDGQWQLRLPPPSSVTSDSDGAPPCLRVRESRRARTSLWGTASSSPALYAVVIEVDAVSNCYCVLLVISPCSQANPRPPDVSDSRSNRLPAPSESSHTARSGGSPEVAPHSDIPGSSG